MNEPRRLVVTNPPLIPLALHDLARRCGRLSPGLALGWSLARWRADLSPNPTRLLAWLRRLPDVAAALQALPAAAAWRTLDAPEALDADALLLADDGRAWRIAAASPLLDRRALESGAPKPLICADPEDPLAGGRGSLMETLRYLAEQPLSACCRIDAGQWRTESEAEARLVAHWETGGDAIAGDVLPADLAWLRGR